MLTCAHCVITHRRDAGFIDTLPSRENLKALKAILLSSIQTAIRRQVDKHTMLRKTSVGTFLSSSAPATASAKSVGGVVVIVVSGLEKLAPCMPHSLLSWLPDPWTIPHGARLIVSAETGSAAYAEARARDDVDVWAMPKLQVLMQRNLCKMLLKRAGKQLEEKQLSRLLCGESYGQPVSFSQYLTTINEGWNSGSNGEGGSSSDRDVQSRAAGLGAARSICVVKGAGIAALNGVYVASLSSQSDYPSMHSSINGANIGYSWNRQCTHVHTGNSDFVLDWIDSGDAASCRNSRMTKPQRTAKESATATATAAASAASAAPRQGQGWAIKSISTQTVYYVCADKTVTVPPNAGWQSEDDAYKPAPLVRCTSPPMHLPMFLLLAVEELVAFGHERFRDAKIQQIASCGSVANLLLLRLQRVER